MGKGQGSHRRAATVKISALVVVLMLTLLVPTLAFAYAGSFSGFTPAKASIVAPSPQVSVIIYDRDGLGGSSNFVMWIDGSRVPVAAYRYSAYGYKRYKMVSQASGLSGGIHTVTVRVKDRTGAYDRTSWTFTVDNVAPVTSLMGSFGGFISPYASSQTVSGLLFLSATDSGSGVRTTYYQLDGATAVAGSLVFYNFGPGNHTLDYWSVDKAGNIEGVHHVAQYLQSGHALPVGSASSSCVAVGCHGGAADVTAIHAKVKYLQAPLGCPCHSSDLVLTNDCASCHVGTHTPVNHATHEAIESSAVAGSGKQCTDSACHGTTVFTYNTPGIHKTCATCHAPTNTAPGTPGAAAAAAIAAGVAGTPATCESCHGDFDSTHTGANLSHQVSGACFTSTCHGTNVVLMHTTDFRGTGATPVGCAACHNPRNNPAVTGTNCQACHFDIVSRHDAVAQHKSTVNGGTNVVALLTANSAGCVSCHGSDLTAVGSRLTSDGTVSVPASSTMSVQEHKGCTCHAYLEASGKTSCESCHGDPFAPKVGYKNGYHITAHDNLKTMLSSATATPEAKLCTKCHGNDVLNIQNGQGAPLILTSGSHAGKTQHEGCSCHVYHEGELTNPAAGCESCHTAFNNPTGSHPFHVGYHNSTLVVNINTNAAACAACHGNDVNHVGSRTAAGGTVTVPADPAAAVQEHTDCSCHNYNEVQVGGGQSCPDCHSGTYGAIHGWKVTEGTGSHQVPGLWNVSGHNTTMMGTVGARTDFSSLGVTDTVGNAPAAQFPLTVNNTFKAGYSWSSVITCEDCHAGLTAYEVAGPHGGSVIAAAGIDPAYPGSFESASLWGGQYNQPLADGTTLTIGPFAEGIAQWANTSSDPEGLAGYQVVTPDMSSATSTKLVAGPASVTAGNVICVKCHDLYDATKSTGFKGWGNYAHEHHSADTGKFTMYFGKFDVGDGGATLTTTTVVAESAAAALAQVPGATKTKQIIAPSLGREDAGACRNCHIAIPHGWKRPKLIVYSNMADPTTGYRASLGLPATGDSAPYNIGPAVYEGEGLNGTAVGSGQMNGLASGIVTFQEAWKDINGAWVTSVTPYANLVILTDNMPALVDVAEQNPLNGATGSEYVNWSASQCNACGHHSGTSFLNPTATQPALTWNSRENNWTSTKPANGAWK